VQPQPRAMCHVTSLRRLPPRIRKSREYISARVPQLEMCREQKGPMAHGSFGT
jgi:hypothetical protein